MLEQHMKEYFELVNYKDEEGNSALYYAASSGNTQMIPFLIEQGINLLTLNNNNDSLLDFALKLKQCNFAKTLIPAVEEAISNNRKIAEFFTGNKNVFSKNSSPSTQNISSVYYWKNPKSNFMINFVENFKKNKKEFKKLCPSLDDNDSQLKNDSPKYAESESIKKAQEIDTSLEKINEKDNFGNAPLHYAAVVGNSIAIDSFIEMGSTLLVRNDYGKTILDAALDNNQCDFAKKIIPFIKREISLNEKSNIIDKHPQFRELTTLKIYSIVKFFKHPQEEFMTNFNDNLDYNIERYTEICGETLD